MKKNTIFFKKLVAITAIALAIVNLIVPHYSEQNMDDRDSFAVCVIEGDIDEDERPLDDQEYI